ncbi:MULTISPECIES: YciI family protein [unclassified Fusibacter]|uniref:YciI family protein n=1 Tax=unclassified Fusibacter TaxID=2624464 RepID=UPI001011F0E9|nr:MULTISPECIES: YciI family protein [unclassified Fusibacter]MCK8060911.1 YciI family protein [Fusibacter sp. A2]NPE23207.1 YciI family protein [Fusibacter sp. A1]RXV59563.1 YciI family protein [Fusibacter sp. A1]
MLFMLIVKASENSEKGNLPSEVLMQAMSRYNEDLVEAGVRVMAKGLHPSSNAMRIYYGEDNCISEIVDGPFDNTGDIVAGFILIDVKSKDEAVYWAKRMPDPQGNGEGQVELRQVYEF